MDKPARTKVTDYIEKAVEDSKKETSEDSTPAAGAYGTGDATGQVGLVGRFIFAVA